MTSITVLKLYLSEIFDTRSVRESESLSALDQIKLFDPLSNHTLTPTLAGWLHVLLKIGAVFHNHSTIMPLGGFPRYGRLRKLPIFSWMISRTLTLNPNKDRIFLQCVHASDFHPQQAVGTDGTCSTTNTRRGGTVMVCK